MNLKYNNMRNMMNIEYNILLYFITPRTVTYLTLLHKYE